MLETTRTGLRFYCPRCGECVRAPRADAGLAIDCHKCGEMIRVPRAPHPCESEGDDTPLIPAPAAALADRGMWDLTASLALYSISIVLAVGVVIAWALAAGPAAVLDREPGHLRGPLAVTALLELALTLTAAGLRWVGYGRCVPAAAAVRAGSWVTVARVGVAVAAVGAILAVAPGLAGFFLTDVPTVIKSVGRIGQLTRLSGIAVELGILFVWARILTEAGGRSAARQVMQYLAALIGAAAATTSVLSLAGMVTVLSLKKDGPLPADPFPAGTPAAIPPEGWYVLGTAVCVAAGFALLLSWQYYHLLLSTRAALAGSDARR